MTPGLIFNQLVFVQTKNQTLENNQVINMNQYKVWNISRLYFQIIHTFLLTVVPNREPTL